MTARADAIHGLVLDILDREALTGGLEDAEEALRLLMHNVRDVPDRSWALAMEAAATAYLSPEQVAALPGRPPDPF